LREQESSVLVVSVGIFRSQVGHISLNWNDIVYTVLIVDVRLKLSGIVEGMDLGEENFSVVCGCAAELVLEVRFVSILLIALAVRLIISLIILIPVLIVVESMI
jgi:hypothetical protein